MIGQRVLETGIGVLLLLYIIASSTNSAANAFHTRAKIKNQRIPPAPKGDEMNQNKTEPNNDMQGEAGETLDFCTPNLACVSMEHLPHLLSLSRVHAESLSELIKESERALLLPQDREEEQEELLGNLTQSGSNLVQNYLQTIRNDPGFSCLLAQSCFKNVKVAANELSTEIDVLNYNSNSNSNSSSDSHSNVNFNASASTSSAPSNSTSMINPITASRGILGFIKGIGRIIQFYYFITSVYSVVSGVIFIVGLLG